MSKFIPLSVPNIKGNEIEYVTQALKEEWVSTAGSFITRFEDKIMQYTRVAGAVACQSGTAGLHLALLACNIERDDEVIVPTLTFVAAVNPIRYIGAEPVFMDCDDNLMLDVTKLDEFCKEECFYDGKNLINKQTQKQIKAIIVVHVFGNLANLKEICKIAERYHLKVIEDATEALGSYYLEGELAGKFAGTVGDIGVYSFNGNKIITTGGGGMIVSNNRKLLDYCRYLSTQAKNDDLYFVHDEIGYNYRMTNLQAALGLGQLERLEEFIDMKQKNFQYYQEWGIKLLPFRKDIRPNYWFYSYLSEDRDGLIKHLGDNQIQARPVWKLIHTLKPYQASQHYKIEKALFYYNRIINIPCSSNLSKTDVEFISQIINNYSRRW